MGSDFYVRMGADHAICQDYAVAGRRAGVDYALLADGCSGVATEQPGSPFTDFGARFLVRSAELNLEDIARGLFLEQVIAHRAVSMVTAAALPMAALDATLIAAVRVGDSINVYQTGDGVIAHRMRSGAIRYVATHYGNNMPFYLSYLTNAANRRRFVELARSKCLVHRDYDPASGSWGPPVSEELPLTDASSPTMAYLLNAAELDMVMVMSDGVESFQDRDRNPVALEDVLLQLFAVKNLEGQFLTRRCTKFQKFCAENGWRHSDDFSVAALAIEGARP